MEATQNIAQLEPSKVGAPTKPEVDLAYEYYKNYYAAGGLRITEDGLPVKISLKQFYAELERETGLKVDHSTLWRRRQADPSFNQDVDLRQQGIVKNSRLIHIWNGLILKAMGGNPQAAEMVLSHFGTYVPPTKKIHVQASGFTDLLDLVDETPTEGEIVE